MLIADTFFYVNRLAKQFKRTKLSLYLIVHSRNNNLDHHFHIVSYTMLKLPVN